MSMKKRKLFLKKSSVKIQAKLGELLQWNGNHSKKMSWIVWLVLVVTILFWLSLTWQQASGGGGVAGGERRNKEV